MNQLILLVGGSGSGKSTVARALQEQLLPRQWLHFSTDTILYCLPRSVVEAADTRNDWSNVDVRAVRRTATACLESILAAGNSVIFDCVVMSERAARDLAGILKAYRPPLIALTCSWEETKQRTLARGDRTLEEAEHGFKTAGLHLEADFTIDTTGRHPAEVARQLLTLLKDGSTEAWRRNAERFAT